MIYDCVIIGGGPAGSVCAGILQRRGYRCLILEKRARIGEKVCGGFLPDRGRQLLLRLGIDLTDFAAGHGALISGYCESRNGKEHSYRYPDGRYGIGMFRRDFDSFLLDQAARQGADVRLDCPVKDYQYDGEYTVAGYKAKALVWAVGARGIVGLKAYDLAAAGPLLKKQSLGISEIIRAPETPGLAGDRVYFWYQADLPDYFWAIPIGPGIWNIGYWSQKQRPDMLRLFRDGRRRYIEPRCAGRMETLRPPTGALLGNWDLSACMPASADICCGDMAGTNNYATGEGLSFAIESAERCAGIICAELD